MLGRKTTTDCCLCCKLDVVAAASSSASIAMMWWIKGVLLRSMQCHVLLCMYIKEGNTYTEHYAFFGIKETRITLFCVIYSLSKCKVNSPN